VTTSSASPPPPPEGRAPDGPAPRPGRWIDTLTTLLLVATACFIAVAAMPALLRAAGFAPFGPSGIFRSSAGGPAREPHPFGAGLADDDEDEEDDHGADPLLGPRFEPFRDRPAPSARGADTAEPDEGAPRDRMRPAVMRRKATLRLSASEDADPTGEVKAGDSVFVVRESGEWVLVLQTGAEGVLMGWTLKNQLAMR